MLALERDLTITQETTAKHLRGQQARFEALVQYMQELRHKIQQLKISQQEPVQHLQRLNDTHANFEPLLSRFNALLNTR